MQSRKSGPSPEDYLARSLAYYAETEAITPLPRQEADVADFAISRFPVTMREYCAFLEDVDRSNPRLADKRAPHDMTDAPTAPRARRTEGGKWEPIPTIIDRFSASGALRGSCSRE